MENKEIYLSVIIPSYNEEKRIKKTLETVRDYLQKQSYGWEVVVALDGPKDNTIDVVRSFIENNTGFNVIDRKENHGKGYTVREGMLQAKGKIRLFMDADGSTDISYFDKMRPLFDSGYDVVISTRDSKDAPGASQEIPQPWHKRLMGNMGNLYIQILAVWGIWDTQNGFKAFRDYTAEKIFKIAKIDRWTFDVEALALSRKFGYKIGIIPIHWFNDANSTVKLSGYIKSLLEVFKIRWYLMTGKYGQ